MPKGQPLRPGEEKILRSLLVGDKTNGELQKETNLQSNILSEYLKNLQDLGLVDRLTNRKYRGKVPVTVEVLFFNEVLEFIRGQFEKSIKTGNEKAGIISDPGSNGWVVMIETPGQNAFVEKRLKDPKNFGALVTVSRIIEDSWEDYYFSTLDRSNPNIMKRIETVEKYKQVLRETAEQLYPLELPQENKELFAGLFESVKKKMLADYAGFNVPEEMIRIETNRRLKEFARRHARIMMAPANLEHLYSTMETFEKLKKNYGSKKDLTEEERQKLEKRMRYLKDPKNKKIYEEHLKHLRNLPKSLIFYTSWGFKGYPEKLSKLIPKQVAKEYK